MPQETIDLIDAAVATGRYRSRGEYIMAAIRLLEDAEASKSDVSLSGKASESIEKTSKT